MKKIFLWLAVVLSLCLASCTMPISMPINTPEIVDLAEPEIEEPETAVNDHELEQESEDLETIEELEPIDSIDPEPEPDPVDPEDPEPETPVDPDPVDPVDPEPEISIDPDPVDPEPEPTPEPEPEPEEGEPEILEEQEEKDYTTVLLYMCGSNLESDYANNFFYGNVGLATMDIMEILSVENQPEDINIIIETGGANKWTKTTYANYGTEDINAAYLQRWHIENKQLVKDSNIAYASMGKSSTLQSFIEYGLTEYPAENTALILWNHGGAMQGVCFDEKKSDDGLTGTEVATAVKNALEATNIENKLEWIGYDACLMGVQDLALINSDYFNYMVGSQELESGYGWDYDNWLDDLYAKKSTEEVLTAICDSFIEENNYNESGRYKPSQNDQTLAYYDLSYANEYKEAWENMSSALKSKINSSNNSLFLSLVKSAKLFANYYEYGIYYYNVYGTIDAYDFIDKLSSNSTFNPGAFYINDIKLAFSKLVPHSAIGQGAGNANGLSMFYALHSYCSKSVYYTSNDTPLTNWQSIVATYGK